MRSYRPTLCLKSRTLYEGSATVSSGSTYSIGPIVDYAWDLDGNGSFETDTGTDPHASHVYPAPAPGTTRRANLRLTAARRVRALCFVRAVLIP